MKILSFDVGIVNLAYCIFDTTVCKIDYWGIIDLKIKDFSGVVPSGNASIAKSANDIHITLITELDNREFLKSVDYVVIEKQPSFNPKMRIIGGCLQSYFYIRGIVDRPEQPIKSVEFFSPKHKLKCYTGPVLTIESKSKSRYTQTKKMAILIAQQKLQEFNETETFKTQFATSRKQDDLADSYLQAITFSLFKKFIKTTVSAFIEPTPKPFTKIEIKSRLKEYLDKNQVNSVNFLTVLNGMDSLLKNSIFTKWNIHNFEGDITFFDELSMKRYKLPFQGN
jgi:hypothetical protein